MLYHRVDCPHCGNEVAVNEAKDTIKCKWCRRLISIKFERGKGKKVTCIVEPLDFPEDSKPTFKTRSQWEEEDIYGTLQNRNSQNPFRR